MPLKCLHKSPQHVTKTGEAETLLLRKCLIFTPFTLARHLRHPRHTEQHATHLSKCYYANLASTPTTLAQITRHLSESLEGLYCCIKVFDTRNQLNFINNFCLKTIFFEEKLNLDNFHPLNSVPLVKPITKNFFK